MEDNLETFQLCTYLTKTICIHGVPFRSVCIHCELYIYVLCMCMFCVCVYVCVRAYVPSMLYCKHVCMYVHAYIIYICLSVCRVSCVHARVYDHDTSCVLAVMPMYQALSQQQQQQVCISVMYIILL